MNSLYLILSYLKNSQKIALVFLLMLPQLLLSQNEYSAQFPWCKDGQLVLLSGNGKMEDSSHDTLSYPQMDLPMPTLVPYEQYGLHGFKNQAGDIVLPASSEEVGSFREGFVWTKLDHKRYLYLDKKGEPLLAYTFDRCFDFQNGLAKVLDFNETKGYHGYGFLNTNGDVVVPLVYQQAFDFVDGLALVKNDGGWWLIDKGGQQIAGPNEHLTLTEKGFVCQLK
ncbi:MAG: WG repeat-containing protein [Bacteroidota bacterium]